MLQGGELPVRVQVPLDRLLLETDAPDGLPRLSGADAADLVPVPEPPSADGSCVEQRASADASLVRSQAAQARQEGDGVGASGVSRDAAGGHCSDEQQAGASAQQEAEQQPGEGSGLGGSAAARELGGAECQAAATLTDDQEAHGEPRTGTGQSGHARPQLNHPANIRCPECNNHLVFLTFQVACITSILCKDHEFFFVYIECSGRACIIF